MKNIYNLTGVQAGLRLRIRVVSALLFVAAYALCTACGAADKTAQPVVSVEPQRALLQEIVGDRHRVVALLAKGANPETFEPTMKNRIALDDALAYFSTGLMPFEQRLAQNATAPVVDCSAGIELIYGTHGHCHDHDADDCDGHHDGHGGMTADPHIWVSVRNARVMARTMTDEMCRLEPENADYYRDNYQRLDFRLDSLDRAFAATLDALPRDCRAFAVWHPSLSYFARDYGLQQIAVGFENKEVSPQHIARMTEQARANNVTLLFFQADLDSRQAETLNAAMGTRMVTINPLAYDWSHQLGIVTDALAGNNKNAK